MPAAGEGVPLRILEDNCMAELVSISDASSARRGGRAKGASAAILATKRADNGADTKQKLVRRFSIVKNIGIEAQEKGFEDKEWWFQFIAGVAVMTVACFLYSASYLLQPMWISYYVFFHQLGPYGTGIFASYYTAHARMIELGINPNGAAAKRIFWVYVIFLLAFYLLVTMVASYALRIEPIGGPTEGVLGVVHYIATASMWWATLGCDDAPEIVRQNRCSFHLFPSLAGYFLSWYALYFYVMWMTGWVVASIKSGRNVYTAYFVFHLSSYLFSYIIGFFGRKIRQNPKNLDRQPAQSESDASSGDFELAVPPANGMEIYACPWWEPYSVFNVGLFWGIMSRTIFLSVGSIEEFIANAALSLLFDVFISSGRIMEAWLRAERKIGQWLPCLVGTLLDSVKSPEDIRAAQFKRFEYLLMRHMSSVVNLIIILPIFLLSHRVNPSRFPTASGETSKLGEVTLILAFAVLACAEILFFIIIEVIFAYFVQHLKGRIRKTIFRIIRTHEFTFFWMAAHLLSNAIDKLASRTYRFH